MSDTGIIALNADNFNLYKEKVRKNLERRFGVYAFSEVAIESVGKKPGIKYGIRVDKNKIRIAF